MTYPKKGFVILNVGYGYNDEVYTIGSGYDLGTRIVPKVYLSESEARDEMRAEYKQILSFDVGGCSYDYDSFVEPIIEWLTNHGHPTDCSYKEAIALVEAAGEDPLPLLPQILELTEVEIEQPPTEAEIELAATRTADIARELSGREVQT